jgi:hypothetical protein
VTIELRICRCGMTQASPRAQADSIIIDVSACRWCPESQRRIFPDWLADRVLALAASGVDADVDAIYHEWHAR